MCSTSYSSSRPQYFEQDLDKYAFKNPTEVEAWKSSLAAESTLAALDYEQSDEDEIEDTN